MAKPGTTDTRNDRISDLVDRNAKNDQLDNPFSGLLKLSDSVFKVPIESTALLISATPSQNDKNIDHLTDMMQSLTFSVRTLQDNTGSPPLFFSPEHNRPIRLPNLECALIIEEMVLIEPGLKELLNVCTVGKQTIILSGTVRFFNMIPTRIEYT